MKENKYRILVVDDEQNLCRILKFNLETESHVVETVNSAEEAMTADISSLNLLLLDVMMDEMPGFSMAKKLKENPKAVNIPITFLIAHDTESDTVTGFNLGADDYISKPFPIHEVLVRVRVAIQGTNEADGHTEPKTLKYQGLGMDSDKKTVTIDSENVPFTKTELELLHLFPPEKRHIFSHQGFIDRIRLKDALMLDRMVDANIT